MEIGGEVTAHGGHLRFSVCTSNATEISRIALGEIVKFRGLQV